VRGQSNGCVHRNGIGPYAAVPVLRVFALLYLPAGRAVSTGVRGPPVPNRCRPVDAAPVVVAALSAARYCSGHAIDSAAHGSEAACPGSPPQRPLPPGRPVSRYRRFLSRSTRTHRGCLVAICPCTESYHLCARTARVRLPWTCVYLSCRYRIDRFSPGSSFSWHRATVRSPKISPCMMSMP